MSRQRIEREIVGKIIDDALAAGYRVSVSLERGYDLDEMLHASTDKEKIMDEAFAGDECHLFIHDATGETVIDGAIISRGWIYLVFGNDGWDVISDYSVRLEEFLKGAETLAASWS